MKNLVLGAAKGYGWDMLEPFVVSFEKNCPSAELVLFVDDISDFTRDRLIQADVWMKNFPDDLKRGVPNNTRWKVFADFLETHGDAYEQIFITDTRDVIFQSDIFAAFGGLKNYLGLTTEADDIGGSKTGDKLNHDWLVDCFGKEMADKLRDRKIICDGTVIGTTAEIKTFTNKMWRAVSDVESRVNFRIHDQAVANYLVYNNLLPIENLLEIDVDGEIFTMALTEDFTVRGEKILRGGRVPAVVHQYNRHNDLINLVDEVYHDKNFQADLRFTDMRSVTEQVTCLLFAKKIGDAAKFFMKKFLVTEDFGDCIKALVRLWEIAMRNPLSPASELLELSAQSALRSFKKFFDSDWEKICVLLGRAAESRHPVDPEFKNYVAAPLFKLAKENFLVGARKQYLYCLELLISMEGGEISWRRN